MTKINGGGLYAAYKPYFLEAGYKKVFIAFDGVPPTQAELDALFTSNMEMQLSDLVTLGKSKGAERGWFLYGTDFVAEEVSPRMYRWETSERDEDMNITSLGDVGWFVFAIVDASINNLSSIGLVHYALIGTVVDVGEDGDAIIPEKRIGANQNYLVNDIELTLVDS